MAGLLRELRIKTVTLENNIFLAPMAGVTDLPFRILCKEAGCGLVYSEMVSAKGLLYGSKNTKKLLTVDEGERPVAVQLFGSDPKILGQMAVVLAKEPIDILDVNMGCPAPKIVKNGEGSALTRDPDRVARIVEAMTKAQDKPVTIKIRKGFDKNHLNAVEVAKAAEAAGAAAIAIHGRTREEYYSGKADWDVIRAVKEAVRIPVIGNGDVTDPLRAEAMLLETGCDGIMIGRAAEGNPWIFSRTIHYLRTGELLPEPTAQERMETALRHARMLIGYKGERIGIQEMRRHAANYTKGLVGAGVLRAAIHKANTLAELEALFAAFLQKE